MTNAEPDAYGFIPHRTLKGEAKRINLLFDVTKFVYEHAIVRQDRPAVQAALKAKADELLRAGK